VVKNAGSKRHISGKDMIPVDVLSSADCLVCLVISCFVDSFLLPYSNVNLLSWCEPMYSRWKTPPSLGVRLVSDVARLQNWARFASDCEQNDTRVHHSEHRDHYRYDVFCFCTLILDSGDPCCVSHAVTDSMWWGVKDRLSVLTQQMSWPARRSRCRLWMLDVNVVNFFSEVSYFISLNVT